MQVFSPARRLAVACGFDLRHHPRELLDVLDGDAARPIVPLGPELVVGISVGLLEQVKDAGLEGSKRAAYGGELHFADFAHTLLCLLCGGFICGRGRDACSACPAVWPGPTVA